MSTTISTSSIDVSKTTLGLLQATGGTAPYRWEIVGGKLPAGLTFTSDGRITGAAFPHGSCPLTLRAIDSGTAAGSALNDPFLLNTPDATGRTSADATITLTF